MDEFASTVDAVVVLLVDESVGVRHRLRERIVAAGAVVYDATDGDEAYALVKRHAPSAIVLDVHVRAEMGLSLLSRLRRLAPQSLVIVLTNETSDMHRRECLREGADHFFDKSHEFDRAVEVILDGTMTGAS